MDQHDHFSTTGRELLFGLAALVLGLFGANMVLCGGFRLGFAIAAVLSIGLSWGYLRRCGFKGSGYSTGILALCLVIAAGFGWSADSFVKFWLFLFLAAGVNLALCLMAGRNRFTPGSARSLRAQAAEVLKYWYIDSAGDFREMTVLGRRAAEILEQYKK